MVAVGPFFKWMVSVLSDGWEFLGTMDMKSLFLGFGLYIPENEHISPVKVGDFESMIFRLKPVCWDMDSFPGGYRYGLVFLDEFYAQNHADGDGS